MINGKHVKCDKCWALEYVDLIGFAKKIDKIRELGWKIIKVRHGWEHHCPRCK